MLIKHIGRNDKIFIQVDDDCDGYTSSAILINYLNCLFPHYTQSNIIYRLHEKKTHGIILDTIPEDTKLVIIPDAGSNQFEEHKILYEKGIDILILDHHEAEYESPYACVINNQMCDYPNKTLSGAGVVYKFCAYIDSLLNKKYAELFLDLVGLGIDADVMDLRNFETHHIVKTGFNNVRNPLFEALVEHNAYSMKNSVNPISVAFYIAPYINAITRSGTINEKITVFESMLEFKAFDKVQSTKRGDGPNAVEIRVLQACRYMNNVKNRQKSSRDAGYAEIEKLIEQNHLLDNKILVICLPKEIEIESSLRGLIANQLMSKYQRPTLVLSDNGDNWEGSARNYDKMATFSNLKDFLNNCPGVVYAEGHQGAMGVSIEKKQYNNFIQYVNKSLENIDFTPCYNVDFIFNRYNLNSYDIMDIGNLNDIWGKGLDEPFVAIENIRLEKKDIDLLSKNKKPTLKFKLQNNNVEFIKFNSSEEEFNILTQYEQITLNVVGRCSTNLYGGQATGQIIIEDYEVISSSNYLF